VHHLNILQHIIAFIPSNVHISGLIVSHNAHPRLLHSLSALHIPFTIDLSSAPSKIPHRRLSSNSTNLSISAAAGAELAAADSDSSRASWVCEPWPIYVAFFSGIFVAVLVSLAMRLTTGDNDSELNTALEKVITAGIEMSAHHNNAEIVAGNASQHKRRHHSTSALQLVFNADRERRRRSSLVQGRAASASPIRSHRSGSVTLNLRRGSLIEHRRRFSHEPSWASDLCLGLKLNATTPHILETPIDEEEQKDIDDEMTSEGNVNGTHQTTEKRGHLKRQSEEMSISSLAKHKEDIDVVVDSEHEEDEDGDGDMKAEHIDLSPIEENTPDKSDNALFYGGRGRRGSRGGSVDVSGSPSGSKSRSERGSGAEYVRRFNGKRIRVGLSRDYARERLATGSSSSEDSCSPSPDDHDADQDVDEVSPATVEQREASSSTRYTNSDDESYDSDYECL